MRKATLFLFLIFSSIHGYSQNPVLPEEWELYIADPEPKVFNGRVYVYGSRDDGLGKGWCSESYHVVSSDDLVNWVDNGESFRLSDVPSIYMDKNYRKLWAPDLLRNPVNGKYYLFFCFNHTKEHNENLMIAESEHPEGPFKNARPLTIDGRTIVAIDPAVMVDDDGKAYVAWPFKIAQLDPTDYSKVISKTVVDVSQWMPLYNTPFEGPSLRKRGDTYYYIYIENNGMRYLPDGTTYAKPTKMAYLTSKHPLGPYESKGVIIENTDYPGSINIHGSLLHFKNQWYVFYHLPVADQKLTRRMCIEPVKFDSVGRIIPVLISSSGIKGAFKSEDTIYAASAVTFSNIEEAKCISRPKEQSILGLLNNNAYAGFRYVDFGSDQPDSVSILLRSNSSGGEIELRTDGPKGPLIASFNVPDTKNNWQQVDAGILKKTEEKKTIYILLKDQNDKPVEILWLRFTK